MIGGPVEAGCRRLRRGGAGAVVDALVVRCRKGKRTFCRARVAKNGNARRRRFCRLPAHLAPEVAGCYRKRSAVAWASCGSAWGKRRHRRERFAGLCASGPDGAAPPWRARAHTCTAVIFTMWPILLGAASWQAASDVEPAARLADKACVLPCHARPVCDGVSKIRSREPDPKAVEMWRSRHAASPPSMSDDDRSWRVFLTAVVDPSEFDDHDTGGLGD
jgi:hypothetical protein